MAKLPDPWLILTEFPVYSVHLNPPEYTEQCTIIFTYSRSNADSHCIYLNHCLPKAGTTWVGKALLVQPWF